MERLNIYVRVPKQSKPRGANVRANMQVGRLTANIVDKFGLIGRYQLRLENGNRLLNPEQALDQAGVAQNSVLICESIRESTGTPEMIQRGQRLGFSKKPRRVYLLYESANPVEYNLGWQPAIIGRKDHADPSKNRLLAIDLGDIGDAGAVSRQHACITESGGQFFIESLNPRNPTIVDGSKLPPNHKQPLKAGARVQVGSVVLAFNVIS